MDIFDKNIIKNLMHYYKEYDDEERRIKELEQLITSMKPLQRQVTDIVTKGKRGKKSLGICRISGTKDNTYINRRRAKLRERKGKKEVYLARIENYIIDAEEYLHNLDDGEIRRILTYYCIDRLSWDEVAGAMGEGYTAEACKQRYSRFMRVK